MALAIFELQDLTKMKFPLFCTFNSKMWLSSADLGAVLSPFGYKLSVVDTLQKVVLVPAPPAHLIASQAVPTTGM